MVIYVSSRIEDEGKKLTPQNLYQHYLSHLMKERMYETAFLFIEKVLKQNHKAMVVVDVDDTAMTTAYVSRNKERKIVETGTYWCTAPWHYTHIDANKDLGQKAKPWGTLVDVDFRLCLDYKDRVPVNKLLNEVLAKFLTTGQVIAVTHRHASDAEKTLEQLKNVGLPFKDRVGDTTFMVDGEDLMSHGVFSIGTDNETKVRRHKGELLQKLFETFPREEQPDEIYVIEDSVENLKLITSTLQDKLGIKGIKVTSVLLDAVEKMQPYSKQEKICLDAIQSLAAERGVVIPSDIQLHCEKICELEVFKTENCNYVRPYIQYTLAEAECLMKYQKVTELPNGHLQTTPTDIELHCNNICHLHSYEGKVDCNQFAISD